jgi:uncharacterized radical SAM superfamily protein
MLNFEKEWNIRTKNFGKDIVFYMPSLFPYENNYYKSEKYFVSISVTGEKCALQCEHCKATILKSMIHVESPIHFKETLINLHKKGVNGFLLSGGSRKDGSVPLETFLPVAKWAKNELKMRYIVHTGYTSEEQIKGLKEAEVDTVLFDMMGNDETIHDIYHLDKTVDDFINMMKNLKKYGLKFSPHVVVGLYGGKIMAEKRALDEIAKYDPVSVVIVVFMPIKHTPMENINPPEPSEEDVPYPGGLRRQPARGARPAAVRPARRVRTHHRDPARLGRRSRAGG